MNDWISRLLSKQTAREAADDATVQLLKEAMRDLPPTYPDDGES